MTRRHLFPVVALLTASLPAQLVQAATYVIDEALSSMTLSANALSGAVTLLGQDSNPFASPDADDSGSRTSFLEGTIEATASASLITLDTALSVIDVKENANAISFGGFLPAELQGTGTIAAGEDEIFADGTVDVSGNDIGDSDYTAGEDNFGFMAFQFGQTGIAALRNFVFTAEGSGVPGAAAGGAAGIGFTVSDGWTAFEAGLLAAPSEVSSITTGEPAAFNAAGDLTYSLVGSLETITIPIDIEIVDPDGDFNLAITGLIVASRTVGLPGDFDEDTGIDGADFLLWQRGGSPTPLSASDLADWEAGYGVPALSAATAGIGAVPEPSSLVLLGLTLGLLPLRVVRRRF